MLSAGQHADVVGRRADMTGRCTDVVGRHTSTIGAVRRRNKGCLRVQQGWNARRQRQRRGVVGVGHERSRAARGRNESDVGAQRRQPASAAPAARRWSRGVARAQQGRHANAVGATQGHSRVALERSRGADNTHI